MPYIHEYINKQELSESIKFTIKLIDNEGVLPDQFIPIILHKSEFCEEKLLDIANQMIKTCTEENKIVEEPIITQETITTEEINNLSTQSEDNIPSDQLNIQ